MDNDGIQIIFDQNEAFRDNARKLLGKIKNGFLRRKFLEFLFKNSAYISYLENTTRRGKSYSTDLEDIINQSFTWFQTPQGYDFWSSRHIGWLCYCRKSFLVHRPNKTQDGNKF